MPVKVTIITATFNSVETIADTLKSSCEQNYSNVEHIIVDGCSTDGTLDVVSRFKHENMRIHSQADSGIYDALNRGLDLASGDVVGFLHSDDFFCDANVIESVAKVFENTKISACYGDLLYVSRTDTKRVVRRWTAGKFHLSRLRFGWMPPHPTFYVRRELLEQYRFNLDLRISADYDAMLRTLLDDTCVVAYIPRSLVCMRTGGASNKNLSNIIAKTKEDWTVIKSNQMGGFLTLLLKNFRKLPQLFSKSIIRGLL